MKRIPMRRCECGHGKDAHRDGRGYCIGEHRLPSSQTYVDCDCLHFRQLPPPEASQR